MIDNPPPVGRCSATSPTASECSASLHCSLKIVAPASAAPHRRSSRRCSPRAKRVIFLFMSGGPSHVDLFDPKPVLLRDTGKPLPFPMPALMRTKTGNMLGSPWKFQHHGQCGAPVSELFPHVASCVDDMCILRGMYADNINHNGACLQMNTGEQAFSRPSMGSWLTYGLGTENQNLPGFVVISPSQPAQGRRSGAAVFYRRRIKGRSFPI